MRIGHIIRGVLAAAWFCGSLGGVAWAQFRIDPPKPYAGGPFPTPPAQLAQLKATELAFPSNYLSAAEAVFAAGFANPQGCDYAEVSVVVGSLWSDEGSVVDTHGWLIPGTNSQRFAVCWNGLVYPVIKTGKPADFRADIAETLDDSYRDNGWVLREEDAVSHASTHALKGLVLLRLGENQMAYDYWASLIERTKSQRSIARQPKAGSVSRLPGAEEVKLPQPDPVPAKPAKPFLPKDAADPFMVWATLWASSALDRSVCAYMRSDDLLAFQSIRTLIAAGASLEKSAEARALPKPPGASRYFDFLDVVPQLLVELTRRTSATATNSADPLEKLLANTNRAERIAGLLARLPDLSPKQRSQSGGLSPWTSVPAVSALTEEGQAAVGPLLAFLESDAAAGYTRAVSFNRDFTPTRILHPVSSAVVETLRAMLRLKSLNAVVSAKELAAAGDKAHVLLATKLRAHVERENAVTMEEGWYRVLTNDSSGLDVWEQAIRGITTPAKGGGRSFDTRSDSKEGPRERLQGEALREKNSPTVAELMQQRIGQWRMEPAQDQLGLTRHLELVRRVGAWQPGAEFLMLRETQAACLEAWNNDSAQARRKAGVAAILGRAIARITIDRVKLGETNTALLDYAAWLRRVTDEDYRQWQESRLTRQHPLEPLWLYPDHPTVAEAAESLFDPARSGLRESLGFSSGLASIAVLESATPLARLPAFRALMAKALQDQTTLGSVRILGGGRFEVRDNSGRITGYRRPSDDKLIEAKDAVALRYCDFVAPGLGAWDGLSTMELYWSPEERDAAIAACLAAMKEDSATFNKREFHGETYEVRRR